MSENVKPESLGEKVARELLPCLFAYFLAQRQDVRIRLDESDEERLAKIIVPLVNRLDGEDLSGDIFADIAETLEAVGCCHGPQHGKTPPMMYPEWIRCAIKHAKDSARLAAPAAPGKVGESVTRIRNALVMLELVCSGFRDAHLLRKEVYAIQSALPEIEASLSRLGASGKAGWTKEIPRGKYGDRLPFWWRDDTYSKRIVEMVIGVDGVASHPTWAITPTSEWCPIPAPEE